MAPTLVAPWLMVNPSRDPPGLKQVTSSRIEKKSWKIEL